MEVTNKDNKSLDGIDIRAAVSILNERKKCDDHNHNNEVKYYMKGQTIQLYGNDEEVCDDIGNSIENDQNKNENVQNKNIQKELRLKLQEKSVLELLQTVLEVQQERVKTYKDFESALEIIVNTGSV